MLDHSSLFVKKKLLHLDEVPVEEIALRSVASQQSTGSG